MIIEHGLLDGQVLQRLRNQSANAVVRGTCTTSGAVRATITRRSKTPKGWRNRAVGQATNGRFSATLKGIPVGGPYEITLSIGTESIIARRVWVGDVWLMAGQSNMQGCGNMDTAPKPHPLVRAMYMDDHWDVAKEPIHFLADSPDPVHYESVGKTPLPAGERDKLRRKALKGVGPGIFFGVEMVKRSGGVPQGLIATAHGGTSMEQWDPAKKHLGGRTLYGSMLRTWRKTGQPVAGVLWYQGESDASPVCVPLYAERMRKFVAAVRRDLRQPKLPFLLVQIGKVFGSNWNAQPWNAIQDIEVRLKKQIKNYDVVTTIDLPLDDGIHVGTAGYARLGVRLARLADRMVYGNRRELPAPELVSAQLHPTDTSKQLGVMRLELKFRNVVGGLRSAGEPTGFELVNVSHGAMRAFYKTILQGDRVILESVLPVKDLSEYKLMHGHGTAPYVNITDARDMAIPVFGGHPVVEQYLAFSPYLTQWLISRIQPATKPVASLAAPKASANLRLTKFEGTDSFVDRHLVWEGKGGQVTFFTEITLSEPMKLSLRTGYDGPIKIWVDNKTVHCDPDGTNPAVADKVILPLNLKKGKHRISLVLDLNGGRAWGFFMRFDRRDVSKAQIARGKYAVPACSL